MTNLITFIKTNDSKILSDLGRMPVSNDEIRNEIFHEGVILGDLLITAQNENEAIAILQGLSGSRADDLLRDKALAAGFDIQRPATEEEVADYYGE